jgi:hypothetical protein
VRKSADNGLYKLSIRPGNFKEQGPRVFISTTDSLNADSIGIAGIPSVSAKAALRAKGYVIRVRVPFEAIGVKAREISLRKAKEIGCTVVLHDIDNEFRPEDETTIATSNLEEMNPSTLGVMMFVTDDNNYGEVAAIFTTSVFSYLRSIGF